MSRWSHGLIPLVVFLVFRGPVATANDFPEYLYQDDDLLCGSGFTPESYRQRVQQSIWQQRSSHVEIQRSIALENAAQQRNQERIKAARSARFEKEARRRDALIAKRKSVNPAKDAGNLASTKNPQSPRFRSVDPSLLHVAR